MSEMVVSHAFPFEKVFSLSHTLNPANGDHFPYLLDVMRWLNKGDYMTKFSEKM